MEIFFLWNVLLKNVFQIDIIVLINQSNIMATLKFR